MCGAATCVVAEIRNHFLTSKSVFVHSRNFLLIIQDGEGSPLPSLFFTGWRRSGGGPFWARSVPPHLSSVLLFERAIREGAISQAFHNERQEEAGQCQY